MELITPVRDPGNMCYHGYQAIRECSGKLKKREANLDGMNTYDKNVG